MSKNAELQAISEQVMNDELIFSGGERLGLNHEQAISINEAGTQLLGIFMMLSNSHLIPQRLA